ncbi:MAG: hypothetical protein WCO66_03050 [Candidatus Absconditabacteria bacterium]
MDYEEKYHKIVSSDKIIPKGDSPRLLKWFDFLGIPYKEEGDKIKVSALYVLKSFFILELYKLYKDPKIIKKYSEMFDGLYIKNKKGGLYSYQLEFYIGYVLQGMDVNIYVLPDSMHILNDGEVEWLNVLFGHIETHIVVSFSELVQKVYNKKFVSKYTKTLTTDEEVKILCEIEEKNPNYKKKQITINFNPDETLRDLDLDAHAPVDKYHEIDEGMDFGAMTKIKHNGIATHIELKKKVSLKKDK